MVMRERGHSGWRSSHRRGGPRSPARPHERPVRQTAVGDVATAGDSISSGVGGSELAGLGRSAGETIDDAVIALTRDLDDFSQSVNDSINAYNENDNATTVSFQQVRHDGPAMTMDDLLRMREEQ